MIRVVIRFPDDPTPPHKVASRNKPWSVVQNDENNGPAGSFRIVTALSDGYDKTVVKLVYRKEIAELIVSEHNAVLKKS